MYSSRVFVRRISCLATIIADFPRVQLHLGIEYLDTNLSGQRVTSTFAASPVINMWLKKVRNENKILLMQI